MKTHRELISTHQLFRSEIPGLPRALCKHACEITLRFAISWGASKTHDPQAKQRNNNLFFFYCAEDENLSIVLDWFGNRHQSNPLLVGRISILCSIPGSQVFGIGRYSDNAELTDVYLIPLMRLGRME